MQAVKGKYIFELQVLILESAPSYSNEKGGSGLLAV